MPSIKQSELDDLHREIDIRRDEYLTLKESYDSEHGRRQDLDGILDKIADATGGIMNLNSGLSYYPGPGVEPVQPPPPTVHEMYERVIDLERRLASVRSIAIFARSRPRNPSTRFSP